MFIREGLIIFCPADMVGSFHLRPLLLEPAQYFRRLPVALKAVERDMSALLLAQVVNAPMFQIPARPLFHRNTAGFQFVKSIPKYLQEPCNLHDELCWCLQRDAAG